jgi:hypothetical protein
MIYDRFTDRLLTRWNDRWSFPKDEVRIKRSIATVIQLTASWGEGDAYAGLQLNRNSRSMAEAVYDLFERSGFPLSPLRPGMQLSTWWLMNIQTITGLFFDEEVAEKVYRLERVDWGEEE